MSSAQAPGRAPAQSHRSGPGRTRSWLLWSTVLVLVAAWAVGGSARPAQAHTSLVSSTPGRGVVVVDPVEVVTLVFSQPVSPRQVQVVVTGPDGGDVAEGPVQVSGGTVSRSLGAFAQSGEHLLAYRVLAADGHPITGQVPFSVAAAAVAGPAPAGTTAVPPTAAPPSAAQPGQPAQPDGTGLVPVLVAGLAGVALVLVVGAVRAGRRAGAGG